MFCGAPFGSEPSLFFNDELLGFGFKPVQDNFQHSFTRMTNGADGTVVLTEP